MGDTGTRWCRHFNGIQHDACRLGIRYDDVAISPELPGRATRIPCLTGRYTSDTVGECASCSYKTADEEAADEVEFEKHFMAIVSVRQQIKKNPRGWRGTVTCPLCDGTLHASISKYNGHVHGRCETESCLQWME